MKTLIQAVQTALEGSDTLSYIRDRDIFISPTENYIPKLSKEHAIGIVPGRRRRSEKMGGVLDVKAEVKVILWMSLLQEDAAIVGTSREKGLLDFSDDVDSVLDENKLGLPGIEDAFCREFSEPVVFGSKKEHGRFLVRLTLTYEYEMEVER